MSNVESYIDKIIGENGGSGPEEPGTPTTVEEAKKNETKFDNTTTIKDGQDNNVVIPGGFHVDKDSGTNVEDGIVIEDDVGNQFVWVPVGKYKTTKGEKTNNLARRTFTSSEATEISGVDTEIDSDYYAEDTTKYTSVAKDTIGAFKTSATTKSGFYIGRYEQGTGNVCKAGVMTYVNLTRDTANNQAKSMYSGNSYVTSELISSYAWDTALNFICQNSEHGYKLATTTDATYGNIFTTKKELTGAYTADKYSNICDVLGNVYEWTTEYQNYKSPCVYRGGRYDGNVGYAAYRNFNSTTYSSSNIGFRTQLYIK